MVHGYALEAVMPDHALKFQLVFHPFQLIERARAMQRLRRPASDRKPLRITMAVFGYGIVAAHRILDAFGLNVSGRRQDSRHVHAVGFHHAGTISVIALLPVSSLLQTSSRQ